uniref:Uncharacterized protein n=1 Tax=Tanacetum cinerariifolium TaxID=118510 RepID=A0A6L2MK94_TANCI|nr:hypothetical protein [Tanacetum cinerariifolium]
MYQADNMQISSATKEHMPYLRFTKVIINHFISKDNTISMRNRINLRTIREDSLLGTLKFVTKTKYCQKYGALIPDGMINRNVKDSKPYKTYYNFSIGKVEPKKVRKFKKPASPRLKTIPYTEGDTLDVSVSKKKGLAKADRGKVIELLSDAALLEETRMKKALKKIKQKTHKLQANGSNKGAGFKSEGDSKEESDDVNDEDENDDDNEEDDSDNDGDNDDGERNKYDDDDDKTYEEGDDDITKELYGDLNITQGLKDTDLTKQGGEDQRNSSHESGFVQEEEDAHFDQRVSALESKVYEFNQTSQFTEAVSSISGIVDNYLSSKLKEEVTVVKSQVFKIIPHIEKYVTESLGAEVLYNTDKYILSTYGDVVTLKKGLDDQDKDEDPSAGSHRGTKRRNKSTKSEEPDFEATDTKMHQDQGIKFGHIDDQPDNEADPNHDWFKKPNKPPTPDRA